LAAVYALLALWPRLLSLGPTVAVVLLSTTATAGVVAAFGGDGLLSSGLAFVPLLLCAAATLIRPLSTAGLAVVHALLLTGLAAAQSRGWIGPPGPAVQLIWPLAAQLTLLTVAAVIGVLMRRAIDASMARARSREQRFAGLLAVAADWYWETDAQLRYTHLSEPVSGASGLALEQRLGKAPWEISDFGLDDAALDVHRSDLELRRPFTDLRTLQRRASRASTSAACSSATGASAATSPTKMPPSRSAAPPSCATASCSRARPRRWCCTVTAACSTPTSPHWPCSAPGSRRI
jgi:PAS domain-containing protein